MEREAVVAVHTRHLLRCVIELQLQQRVQSTGMRLQRLAALAPHQHLFNTRRNAVFRSGIVHGSLQHALRRQQRASYVGKPVDQHEEAVLLVMVRGLARVVEARASSVRHCIAESIDDPELRFPAATNAQL